MLVCTTREVIKVTNRVRLKFVRQFQVFFCLCYPLQSRMHSRCAIISWDDTRSRSRPLRYVATLAKGILLLDASRCTVIEDVQPTAHQESPYAGQFLSRLIYLRIGLIFPFATTTSGGTTYTTLTLCLLLTFILST